MRNGNVASSSVRTISRSSVVADGGKWASVADTSRGCAIMSVNAAAAARRQKLRSQRGACRILRADAAGWKGRSSGQRWSDIGEPRTFRPLRDETDKEVFQAAGFLDAEL